MYNCAPQIPRVIRQLEDPRVQALVGGVVCIDNRSTDGTAEAAASALAAVPIGKRSLLRNDDNYGLGGSHKVAIEFARREGYEHLIVLHGDDQGAIIDILKPMELGQHRANDFLMGARFMRGSSLQGYALVRTAANHVFNIIFSVVAGKRLYDLGSGLNLFRVSAFDDGFHMKFADGLTFNYYLILAVAARGHTLRFFPLTWREEDQVSNAKLGRMGVQILGLLSRRIVDKRRFLAAEHREVPRPAYPSTELARWTE
jgi:glycosyltransferase involved in cell wall biosynthesis